MTNDITILSCPQCGFPRIRDCGNGLYQCDDCGTHFDKNENIVLTNEEWLQTATTEQLAEWLEKINEFVNVCDFIGGCQKCPFECCDDNCNDEHYQARVWLWWLKEKHTNEVAE